MSSLPTQPRQTFGDVLTLGFATAVTMWAVGFFARLPVGGGGGDAQVIVPSAVLYALLVVVLFAGGFAAQRFTQRGLFGGFITGLICGAINLLVIGGLITDGGGASAIRAIALVGGTLGACVGIATVGALAARYLYPEYATPGSPAVWLGRFAATTACATLVLLMVGGAVTGADAGLAVVDWPNTEGYLMWLFPLSRMTGGIYLEHAHRLFGTLVGLCTLTLAFYLQAADPRRWIKRLGWAALVLVCVQGVLGGLRVTGRLTLSTDPTETAPNLTLAIVHGVLGQLFFGITIFLAAATTRTWRSPRPALRTPLAQADYFVTALLLVTLVLQLILGALVRHLMSDPTAHARVSGLLMLHIVLAIVVLAATIGVGTRSLALHRSLPVLSGVGRFLLIAVATQFLLGVLAYIVVYGGSAAPHTATGFDVLITTAHQTVGALLLAGAVLAAAWTRRLLTPLDATSTRRVATAKSPSAAATLPAG